MRIVFVFALFTVVLSQGPAFSQEYAEGELIIAFTSSCQVTHEEVSPIDCEFGLSDLDSVLQAHQVVGLQRLIPPSSPHFNPQKRICRTYLVHYDDGTDPEVLLAELLQYPYFEYVVVNRIAESCWFGASRSIPTDSQFPNQWSFDYTRDSVDTDMPEAWRIEKGDPSVVITILDSGMLLLTTPNDATNPYILDVTLNDNFKIHSDFGYHWTAEDNEPFNVLNWSDYDVVDASDPDTLLQPFPTDTVYGFDNVLGWNYSPRNRLETNQQIISFWRNTPVNWGLIDPNSGWGVGIPIRHGLKVAGIAAASASFQTGGGNGVAGVANGCSVNFVRADRGGTTIFREAIAFKVAGSLADVINMSWGFCPGTDEEDLFPFADAIKHVANDLDVVLVAAVGNESTINNECNPPIIESGFPARFPEVMGVGNMDSTLVKYHDSVYGPNIGDVSVVAPTGHGIPTTSHCEFPVSCPFLEIIVDFNGTSAAAPQVAGIAGLLRSRFPLLTQAEIRQRIKDSAEYYWTSSVEDQKKYGAGKVNAYRALTEWGTVDQDTTWGAPGWPDTMYVSGDLTIPAGVTLTIQPGTWVRAAPDHERSGSDITRVQIVVEGNLSINATSSNPVVFEGFTDSAPTDTDWAGIFFSSTSTTTAITGLVVRNAAIGIESDVVLTLDDCVIEACSVGVQTSVDLTVNNSTIIEASRYGVYGVSNNLNLSGCEIRGSGALASYGVRVFGGTGTLTMNNCEVVDFDFGVEANCPVSIADCSIESVNSGITGSSVIVTGSSVVYNSQGISTTGDLDVTACQISNGSPAAFTALFIGNDGIVRASSVTGPVFGVLAIGDLTLQSDTITTGNVGVFATKVVEISDSRLLGTTGALKGIIYSGTDSLRVVRTYVSGFDSGIYVVANSKCVIDSSCNVTGNDVGIDLDCTSNVTIRNSTVSGNTTNGIYLLSSSAEIVGNTIENNGTGIFCMTNSSPSIRSVNYIQNNGTGIKCDDSSSPVIHRNKISGNSVGIAALNSSNPAVGTLCGAACDSTCGTEGWNRIESSANEHIVNLTPGVTIIAECNYWGTYKGGSPAPPANKFSGAVDYTPHLTSTAGLGFSSAFDPGNEENGNDFEDEESKPETIPPIAFSISSSYPNPFNPSMSVRFAVPRGGGQVSIRIFSVSGHLVRTLVDEGVSEGYHIARWHGIDDRGQPVVSGIYFLSMTAKDFGHTQKIVLLK